MFIQTKSHYTHSLRITKPKIGRFHFHSFEASLTSGINYKDHNHRTKVQVSPSYVRCFNCQENNGPWLKENQKHIPPGTQHDGCSSFLCEFFLSRLSNDSKLNEVCGPATSPSCFHKANLQRPGNIVSVETILSDINYSQHMSSLRELGCRRSLLPGRKIWYLLFPQRITFPGGAKPNRRDEP